jgi:hypothetical protein
VVHARTVRTKQKHARRPGLGVLHVVRASASEYGTTCMPLEERVSAVARRDGNACAARSALLALLIFLRDWEQQVNPPRRPRLCRGRSF